MVPRHHLVPNRFCAPNYHDFYVYVCIKTTSLSLSNFTASINQTLKQNNKLIEDKILKIENEKNETFQKTEIPNLEHLKLSKPYSIKNKIELKYR